METIYNETTIYPDTLVFKEDGVLNSIITMNIDEFNEKLINFEKSQKDFTK